MCHTQHLALVKHIIVWVWTVNKVEEVGKYGAGGAYPIRLQEACCSEPEVAEVRL